jgi:DNA polymerase I
VPEIIDTATLDLSTLDNDRAYWIYNGLDAAVTEEIFRTLYPMTDESTRRTYEFSKALQAPVLEMNLRGLRVNKRRKHRVVKEMNAKVAQLEAQLDRLITEGVGATQCNWRSPKQLKELLYDVMGLPVQRKRNANGAFAPTTDESALEKLSSYYIAEPICNHLLTLRSLGKSLGFLNTNIDSDGRMRTQFNIAGTDTGRFASSVTDFGTGTNLQNVTGALRSIFVADRGMKFCNLDLEQGDSRNVGALCWDMLMEEHGEAFAGRYLDACESGDLHTYVTKLAYKDLPWGSAPDREVAEMLCYRHYDYRFMSKKLGHGSNYLGQPPTMAKHARIPVQIAKQFQSDYFTAFPCIPAWHQKVFWHLENLGFLETLFGDRRFFFDRPKEGATRRVAVAHCPQSMTAKEINTGILNLWRADRVQLLVQVHDSILFQFPEEQEDEIVPWALEALKVHLPLKGGRDFCVPTEAATGWNWGYYETWTAKDFADGKCSQESIGTCKDNPDGLKKWRGGDSRRRQEEDFALSLLDF